MKEQENKNIQKKTLSNLIWRFIERCGAQGVSFIVSIILARILEPSDYGLIALVTVFTNILQVFVDSGLGNALIQKKDADEIDFSTVFYMNMFFCAVIYLIAYFVAPFIAEIYDKEELILIFRVLSLTILISGVKNVQQAYVARNLLFKKFFFATVSGTIGAAIIGVYMAYQGFGVWALVAQQIFNVLIDTIILWVTVGWYPKIFFSFPRLKELFSYGWKLLLSSLITTIYNDIRQLIIGKVYSSADLAYYNKGKQFPNYVVNNINSSIDSVLFPVMADCQDNKEKVKIMTRRAIKVSSYIMWPMMLGMAAVGEPVIKLLLTDKWLQCLPYLYIFCFVNGMMPIHTANLNAIKAVGRSDLYLKMEIIKKSVGLVIIFVTKDISVLAIGLGSIVYTLFASIVNSYPNKHLLNYSYSEQIRDIIPSLLLSIIMAIIVYLIPASKKLLVEVMIKCIIGLGIYVGGSYMFKLDSYMYIKTIIQSYKKTSSIYLNFHDN